ncbi:MAG: hypothetical protein F4033_14220 [Acidimicrobiaceae bacterium]|nr:hypothetical protein [Acidimicrobiaceae bacterium]
MERERSDLLVFIDLGFVLLAGFLILTETTPRINVALPGKAEETAASEDESQVFNLRFGRGFRFLVDDGQETLCSPESLESLVSCMERLPRTAIFVLIPEEQAPVQHLVSLLDLCRKYGRTCTVPN